MVHLIFVDFLCIAVNDLITTNSHTERRPSLHAVTVGIVCKFGQQMTVTGGVRSEMLSDVYRVLRVVPTGVSRNMLAGFVVPSD